MSVQLAGAADERYLKINLAVTAAIALAMPLYSRSGCADCDNLGQEALLIDDSTADISVLQDYIGKCEGNSESTGCKTAFYLWSNSMPLSVKGIAA